MWCLYVARNLTKCPLMRDVRLREVSVSGGSTVHHFHTFLRQLWVGGCGSQTGSNENWVIG